MKRLVRKYLPNPPPPRTARLTFLLLLAVLAGPLGAQTTTITSDGREGPTTCVNIAEVDATNTPITALSTSSVTVTAPQVTWSQLLAQLGDGQAPINALIAVNVFDVRTGASVGNSGTVASISSSSPTYTGGSVTRTGLTARTPYRVEVDVSPAGGTGRIRARRCFMTGGTYTVNVGTNNGERNSGCFSISPLTRENILNCLCGRGLTTAYTNSVRGNWGCR